MSASRAHAEAQPSAAQRAALLHVMHPPAWTRVTRSELHKPTSTRAPITCHDLRGTGATWMAVRRDDPLKIKRRCGHTTFATTEIYIRDAEAVREGFGDVFPSLPECLGGPGGFGPVLALAEPKRRKSLKQAVPGTEGGTRTPEFSPNCLDLPRIDTVNALPNLPDPLRNPATPHSPESSDDCVDDSIDVGRVRELIAAAVALAPTGGPCAVLLGEALKALEPRADRGNVVPLKHSR
jgi:hypothetical protein